MSPFLESIVKEDCLSFFNPWTEVQRHRNRLPHWQQPGATYYITYRLADAIPASLLSEWRMERETWLKLHPKPWCTEKEMEYHKRFSGSVEQWLDQGHGSCALREERLRILMNQVITKFDKERYWHHCWVIMPNHLHLLFTLNQGESLDKVVKAWKGVSSRAVQKILKVERKHFWAADYFDRMIRDETHFWNVARYIRCNPTKANLKPQAYSLYESDYVRDYLDV